MATMGDRLQKERKRRHVTQVALARTTGVGLATIRRIEQHMFEPRLDTVRRLAAALNVRAGWLAFGEEPRTNPSQETKGDHDGE